MTTGAEIVLMPVAAPAGTTPAQVIGDHDRAAYLAAAQAAGAHAFVSELPEGYHTPVGDGGVTLTASQWLRLSIARMLAADLRAIVLDDPTAGLDAAGEAAVLPGLEALLRGRDVTMVAASPAVRALVSRGTRPAGGPRLPDVARDPALPSLGRLLDVREMAPLLGRTLVHAEVRDIPDVRVQSVRYKPGDSAVVQYSVLTRSGWATAVAYSRRGVDLKRKRRNPVNRRLARRVTDRVPSPKALARLPEVSALVQWMPLDLRLPILADTSQGLADRLAKTGIAACAGEPELLRYWPRRRAVLHFGPYVLKVYRDRADFRQALHALRASAALTRVRAPAYEGHLKALHVTVQKWVPGRTPTLWPASSHAAGAILADLHSDPVPRLPTTAPADVLAKAKLRAEFVSHLLPWLRSDVGALVSDLARQAPSGGRLVTSHGNFHAGQLLAGPTGFIVLDFDRMCHSAPAYDLATFATHLVFGRPGDLAVMAAAVDSLVAGYGSRPADLEWYLATCLVRRAAVPFRFQDEHWPAAVAELLRLAREVLR